MAVRVGQGRLGTCLVLLREKETGFASRTKRLVGAHACPKGLARVNGSASRKICSELELVGAEERVTGSGKSTRHCVPAHVHPEVAETSNGSRWCSGASVEG